MPDLLKKLPSEIKKNKLKTGIFLGFICLLGNNSCRYIGSIPIELTNLYI